MKIVRLLILSIILSTFFIWALYLKEVFDGFFSVILVLIVFIIHILLYKYYLERDEEFKRLNKSIEDILEGNHDTRIILTNYEENKILNANVNRLAKRMEKMTFKKEEDEQTIKFLTNNITSPIIYIDLDGRVRYLNDQFLNKFKVQVYRNELYEKIRIKNLYKFIDDAFILETDQVLTLHIKESYYQANAITIKNNLDQFVGILFIFHDITDIKKYEKLQREFLADASHELKTPLSAIKGASEILLNGNHEAETVKDFLSIIKLENERMEKIVRDILLISRIESENLLITTEEVNIKELLEESIGIVEFKLKSKNQNLDVRLSDDLIVKGDYERLKHAFLNLITNAINYTNENKSIFISGKREGKKIYITIEDQGIGISKHELPHIFERFYRVDKARSRDTGGTGLGLSIVKSTMDIHKAAIHVESEEGNGTKFTLTFRAYSN